MSTSLKKKLKKILKNEHNNSKQMRKKRMNKKRKRKVRIKRSRSAKL